MCDEQIMKKWFEKQPKNFLKCYWNYLVKRAYILMAIYGTFKLHEADWLRLYKQSIFYRWRLMGYGEFYDEICLKIRLSERRMAKGGGNRG